MTQSLERSPQIGLRLAGLLYLAIIALGLFGEAVVRGSVVLPGDAAATAARIAAEPLLWRAGIAGDLLMHVLDLPVILALYYLLRPVSRPLALLATLFNLVQTAVLAANKLNLLLPILLLQGSGTGQAFSATQLQALTALAINLHGYGFGIGLIFFGIACLLRGWLIARSGFLPKPLGLLLLLAGLSYLLNSFALLLAPKLAAAMFPVILMPAFVGELALALWLIVKGVDLQQWRQRRADSLA
ncbi:DUF4386 domain-containing protein [Paucibacter sp. PLA-PC-4]|uniref:DUF4386 domain-containing protein n=1 Tax=Paucibacter sp. PLA-PC-4 TaxID=2993655 RepID=UPI0022499476|nr:DUF4386 domain-containing protein [Paucibacter sp. PLA-PC-4]MCX2860523.1 DUF4386 domain-containing protein [Paucibacter sp. PLA-PC-4]